MKMAKWILDGLFVVVIVFGVLYVVGALAHIFWKALVFGWQAVVR
jgi:hypothetical protein